MSTTETMQAWVDFMLAGGFKESESGVPPTVGDSVEALLLSCMRRRNVDITESAEPDDGEAVGIRLELEDIARER